MSSKVVLCVAALLATALSAPVDVEHTLETTTLLERADLKPTPVFTSTNITVPCTLCASAMPAFLDFCKDVGGYSVPHVTDFVGTCSLIGEEEAKAKDKEEGCVGEMARIRSRARMWNRKLRCLRIYNAMAKMYSPFDPCTQIRFTAEKAPMSVCHSNAIRCVPPPTDEPDLWPPQNGSMALAYEFPPQTCPQYVIQIERECRDLKSNDFYSRSNLDSYCDSKFGDKPHQKSGCLNVLHRMTAEDHMMDLCSALKSAPITVSYMQYCSAALHLPENEPVPDPGYAAYLERLRLFREAWEMTKPHSNFTEPQAPVFPIGDQVVVVRPPTLASAPAPKVEVLAA